MPVGETLSRLGSKEGKILVDSRDLGNFSEAMGLQEVSGLTVGGEVVGDQDFSASDLSTFGA